MSSSVQVRSIQALEDLKGGLRRFGANVQGHLGAVEQQIRNTEIWLKERQSYWRQAVQREGDALHQAETALTRCRASGFRDDQGNHRAPDCHAYEQAQMERRRALQSAEAELDNVQAWSRRVDQASGEYQIQARRLAQHVDNELPRATNMLNSKIALLWAYSSGIPNITTSLPSAPLSKSGASAASGISSAASDIQDVSLSDIDLSDSHIKGAGDYKKVSIDQMRDGLQKLQSVVRPAVANGMNGEQFRQLDSSLGLDYSNGYLRIYDAFYGQDSIRLAKVGNHYTVINGYHRLYLAQELGLINIPAHVSFAR